MHSVVFFSSDQHSHFDLEWSLSFEEGWFRYVFNATHISKSSHIFHSSDDNILLLSATLLQELNVLWSSQLSDYSESVINVIFIVLSRSVVPSRTVCTIKSPYDCEVALLTLAINKAIPSTTARFRMCFEVLEKVIVGMLLSVWQISTLFNSHRSLPESVDNLSNSTILSERVGPVQKYSHNFCHIRFLLVHPTRNHQSSKWFVIF